ncbi:MAG: SURF1 family protein [Rickettsiales bacterium]|nr:SURF1 family protein [Rickettsiales bacterium]
MNNFKPKLIPTLFTIPSLIVLLILGTWQVQRLFEKEAYISLIEEAQQSESVPLPKDQSDVDDLLFRNYVVKGEFLHDKEIHLYGSKYQSYYGAGYHIITPFRLSDDDTIVMVNRGWIPENFKEPSSRPDSQASGTQTVKGTVIEAQERRWFLPENDTNKNVWIWMDIELMAEYVGEAVLPFIFMEVDPGRNPRIMPVPSDGKFTIRNDHFEYAITWYSFAFILCVIYYLYHRKTPQKAS